MCTLQSCAGHRTDQGWYLAGKLWVWLDEDMAGRFYRAAPRLMFGNPLMEHVAIQFSHEGREFVSIGFQGQERDHLEESQLAIYAFIAGLREP